MQEDEWPHRSPPMRDLLLEERKAMAAVLTPPVCMYRLGESRIFASPKDVPEGEGWVDSPAKVRPMTQIEPVVSVSAVEAPTQPETLPASGEAPRRRGRKVA